MGSTGSTGTSGGLWETAGSEEEDVEQSALLEGQWSMRQARSSTYSQSGEALLQQVCPVPFHKKTLVEGSINGSFIPRKSDF